MFSIPLLKKPSVFPCPSPVNERVARGGRQRTDCVHALQVEAGHKRSSKANGPKTQRRGGRGAGRRRWRPRQKQVTCSPQRPAPHALMYYAAVSVPAAALSPSAAFAACHCGKCDAGSEHHGNRSTTHPPRPLHAARPVAQRTVVVALAVVAAAAAGSCASAGLAAAASPLAAVAVLAAAAAPSLPFLRYFLPLKLWWSRRPSSSSLSESSSSHAIFLSTRRWARRSSGSSRSSSSVSARWMSTMSRWREGGDNSVKGARTVRGGPTEQQQPCPFFAHACPNPPPAPHLASVRWGRPRRGAGSQ